LTHANEVVRAVKGNMSNTLNARMGTGANQVPVLIYGNKFRRLTPLECERLMGLPDYWTLIDDKSCSDSARYKALGNGMAQPVADWIISKIGEAVKCTSSEIGTAELGLLPQVFSATSISKSTN
jgi:DNA (cytosine-5)-methyltransferase 1